jgi:tetratricopeptide (TPR) repeat protein
MMENLPPDFGFDPEDSAGMHPIEFLVKEFESELRAYYSQEELEELCDYYQQGMEFDPAMGEWLLKVCEIGQRNYPYCSQFLLSAARVHFVENSYSRAQRLVSKAGLLDRTEPELHLMQGLLHTSCNENPAARESFLKAIELAENREEMIGQICNDLIHFGFRDQAIPLLEEISETDSLDPWVLDSIVHFYLEKDLPANAAELVQRHIDANPYSGAYWNTIGQVYRHMGLNEKAIWAFDFSLAIDENDLSGLLNKFETQYDLGDYHGARETFGAIDKGLALGQPYNNMFAWTLYETGFTKEARRLYRNTVNEDPEDGEAWYGLALTYMRETEENPVQAPSGNLRAALLCLQKAVSLHPDEQQYRMLQAEALGLEGHVMESNDVYIELSKRFPLDPEVWTEWAWMLHNHGNDEAASIVLSKSLEHIAGNPELLYLYAAACFRSHKPGDGIKALELALHENFAEHPALFNFAPELKQSPAVQMLIARFTP